MQKIHLSLSAIIFLLIALVFASSCNDGKPNGGSATSTTPPPVVGEAPTMSSTADSVVISKYGVIKNKLPGVAGGLTIYNAWHNDSLQFIIANPSASTTINPCPAPNYPATYYAYYKDNCPKSCDINLDILPNLTQANSFDSFVGPNQTISKMINDYNALQSPALKVAALPLNMPIMKQLIADQKTLYIVITLTNNNGILSVDYQGYDINKAATIRQTDSKPVYFTVVSKS